MAFAKDSTVDSYCNNEDPSENEEWCLEMDEYVALPAFGRSPSHPVMYNPEIMDNSTLELLTESLVGMSGNSEGALILENVLNTGAIVETNAQDHLGSYSTMLSNIPGISAYYSEKYDINETVSPSVDTIRLAFEVKSDYDNIDANPQLLADFLSDQLAI